VKKALSASTPMHWRLPKATMVALGCYACVVACALVMLPGAPVLATFVAMTVMCAAACLVLANSAGNSVPAQLVLVACAAVLAVGVIANVYSFTTMRGATDAAPVLINSDASRNWNDAMYYYEPADGATRSPMSHGMFCLIPLAVMVLAGKSITAQLLVSMACTLVSLICASTLYVNVTARRRKAWMAMACAAAVCYFMASGMILVKDAWVIMSMSLCAVALTRRRRLSPVILLAGVMFMSLGRPNMIIAVALGVIIMAVQGHRRRWQPGYYACLMAICLAGLLFSRCLNLSNTPGTVVAGGESLQIYFNADNQMPYYRIVGDFLSYPLWQRVLMLPFTAAVQFFIPFPWNWLRDIDFGLSQIYAHFSYPWYAFGAVMIYYMVSGAWRRGPGMLTRLSLWAVVVWLAPCVLFGGTISRYALMAVPMMSPAVAYTLERYRARKSFRIYAVAFAIAVIATLAVCHHLQTAYIS